LYTDLDQLNKLVNRQTRLPDDGPQGTAIKFLVVRDGSWEGGDSRTIVM